MMDIEFRFFRKLPTPKMIYPEADFLVNHLGVPMGILRYVGTIEVSEISVIPLLYTGQKDKNGKKIYNGDILLVGKAIYKIEYRISSFKMIGVNISTPQGYVLNTGSYVCEIIGNIYENPELLK